MKAKELSYLRLGQLGIGVEDAAKLISSAGSLHRIYERQCNGYANWRGDWDQKATDRDDKREQRLNRTVEDIATEYDLRVYFQGDPRGWPIYLYREQDLDGRDIQNCYSAIGTGITG